MANAKAYDTRRLARLVSALAGQPIEIRWVQSWELPPGLIGAANAQVILLDEKLARRSDPILPEVIYHEIGHVVLHKRVIDKAFPISQEEIEREATIFHNEMLLRLGSNFIWDALTGDLSAERERRGRAEFEKVAALKTFTRNNTVVKPYQRSSQGDVAVTRKGQMPQRPGTPNAQHRTRPGTSSAQALEAQARHEYSLAAKQTDLKVRGLIEKSAAAKVEAARSLRVNGVLPAQRHTGEPLEYSQPQWSTPKVRR